MTLTCLGKYEIREEIGRGAMGVVYRAFDPALQRDVAIKTMAISLAAVGDDERLRFNREARSAGRLRHPNIVTIYEMGEDGGTPFIAMELLEGTDLASLLAAGDVPSLRRRVEIVSQLCDGLDFAHRNGIVHRDVKPANVFIQADGRVKILDFGIAKLAASDATRTGTVIGTVDYMSPEQVRADRDLDGRSDVFSAGVILYELLFRRKPFPGESLASVMYRIVHTPPVGLGAFDALLPPGLAGALRRALEKERHRRHASAAEMARQLERAAAEMAGPAGRRAEDLLEQGLAAGRLERDGAERAPAGAGSRAKATGAAPAPLRGDAPATRSETPPAAALTHRPGRRMALLAAAALLILPAALLAGLALQRPADGTEGEGRSARAGGDGPPPSANVTSSTAPDGAGAAADRPLALPEGLPGPAAGVAAAGAPLQIPDEGALALSVMPWARLESIEELATGRRRPSGETTPLRLSLPAGRYRIRLTHPSAGQPLLVETEIEAGRTTVLSERMPGFEGTAALAELLGAGSFRSRLERR